MFRSGSNVGVGMFRSGSNVRIGMFRRGSNLRVCMFRNRSNECNFVFDRVIHVVSVSTIY